MRSMDKPRSKGFTLIEMLITLTVAGILVGIMVPNMRDFIRNNRLSSAVNDMLHSLQMARTEAIKRQNGNVVWCGTSNPTAATPTCDYTNFTGWFVFQDTNGNWQHEAAEPVIEVHDVLDASITVKTDANDRIVSFSPSGFANLAGVKVPVATIVLCDIRGVVQYGTQASARTLIIAPTGRARASATWNDVKVSSLPKVVGGSCP
jgi:type IV fimbrial biogenesis protein FimT